MRFSNSNRIIPSDYRILLLFKLPITTRLQDLCLMHRKVHEQLSVVMQRNAFEFTYEPTAIHSFHVTSQPYGNAHLEGKTRLSSTASQFVLSANVLRQ